MVKEVTGFVSEEALEEFLSAPTAADIDAVRRLPGDFVILGAGGKMGPTLAMRVSRAVREAGTGQKVYAVSRFSDRPAALRLLRHDVVLIEEDLLGVGAKLPHAENVLFLAGRKFGSEGQAGLTWMMNVVVPAKLAERYAGKRTAVLSSGNVYPLRRTTEGGANEQVAPQPVGEYAQTVLGRERVYEHAAATTGSPVILLRLNYAVEPRYGVLTDLAEKIWAEQAVDVSMPAVNVIWQGDANSYVLRSLLLADVSAPRLNIAGADVLPVRDLALRLGGRLGKEVRFAGVEAETALLNDASECRRLLGEGQTGLESALDWTADWVKRGMRSLGKPTHFETRDGKF